MKGCRTSLLLSVLEGLQIVTQRFLRWEDIQLRIKMRIRIGIQSVWDVLTV
jgi:hypothetical protein